MTDHYELSLDDIISTYGKEDCDEDHTIEVIIATHAKTLAAFHASYKSEGITLKDFETARLAYAFFISGAVWACTGQGD